MVTEEQVLEEEMISEDFKLADVIMKRILKKFPATEKGAIPEVLFTLCLIYVRQLRHHKYEEIGK